ncbi:MAG: hypothetical protein ACRCUY_02690, partial [Thermoguttaceae bacterium]
AFDLRSSSPRIFRAVLAAIQSFGVIPIDCGTLPSPALALYGFSNKIPSIMITGSHIPADRNGIKFFLPERELLKHDESEIKKEIVSVPDTLFDATGLLKPENVVSPSDGSGAAQKLYIDRFVRAFSQKALEGCRIGFYEHSAVGRDLLFDLLVALGAQVTRLGRSNEFIAIDTEAVRDEDLFLAKNWASGHDLPSGLKWTQDRPPFDAIFSTDGDSDRPLLFDEQGELIRGDTAGILTSRFLLADCVVTPINSNTALEKSGWFKKIIRTKIGSPFVVEGMNLAVKEGFKRVCGYEANGGFLTANSIYLDEDDPRFSLSPLMTREPAIVLIAVLCFARRVGVSLSEITSYLPRRIAMSDWLHNFPTDIAKRKLEELDSSGPEFVHFAFAAFGDVQYIDRTDGLRITFGDGDIVHLRAAGNTPGLRCYTESDTKDRATQLLYKTMTILDSWRRRDQNDTFPYQH